MYQLATQNKQFGTRRVSLPTLGSALLYCQLINYLWPIARRISAMHRPNSLGNLIEKKAGL